MKILVINPGSTSTKIAVFEDRDELYRKTIEHDSEYLSRFGSNQEQLDFRTEVVLDEVKKSGFSLEDFSAVCSRGGTFKPVESGTYLIDEDVLKDAADPKVGGRHPSALGVQIASTIGKEYGIPAYFSDPVSTDELIEEARFTGMEGMVRDSMFHALNQKSACRKAAEIIGKPYEELNLIGVHMGGGVSIVAHRKGKAIDNYNVINEGSFSMDRGGSLPTTDIINLCFSGITKEEVSRIIKSKAGVFSYLGTKDFKEVEQRAENGDEKAAAVFRAMVYQHCKDIGSMAAVMDFDVDAIVLTGGIANSKKVTDAIRAKVERLAQVIVIPGENEMQSLADNTCRVLQGEPAKKY
ncbi:MAG: butyrate kinase [Emergencia sp.]